MSVRNCLHKKALCFKVFEHCLSCLVAVHAVIACTRTADGRVVIHYIYLGQIVSLTYLKVVRIVGRCDFYAACSELLIYIRVRNNRYLTVDKRKHKCLSYYILITLILGIYSNSGISEQSLRSGGGYLDKASFLAHYGVVDMPEVTLLLLMYNLSVGDGGLAHRAPVDYP